MEFPGFGNEILAFNSPGITITGVNTSIVPINAKDIYWGMPDWVKRAY
jgi:hypothetical protein